MHIIRSRKRRQARKRTNKNKCSYRRSKKYSRRRRNYNGGGKGNVIFGTTGSDESESSGTYSSGSSESSGSSGSSRSSRSTRKISRSSRIKRDSNCVPSQHSTLEACNAAGCDRVECMRIHLDKLLKVPNEIGNRNLDEFNTWRSVINKFKY